VTAPPAEGTPPTDRELAVLLAVAEAGDQETAAVLLGIGVRTVESHLRNVRSRLGAASTLQAYHRAVRTGLIAVASGIYAGS